MPKILQFGAYVLFFWVSENNEPVHVHVAIKRPTKNATKIWLTASGGCVLANNNSRIPNKDLGDIMELVTLNHSLICEEWKKAFQGDINFYC